jgi:hypothetical protein
MRERSASSPSDLRRPDVLAARPSCAVYRSDMHVHGELFLLPMCVLMFVSFGAANITLSNLNVHLSTFVNLVFLLEKTSIGLRHC